MINYYFLRTEGRVQLNPYDATTDRARRPAARLVRRSDRREPADAVIEPYVETFDGAQGDRRVLMTSATSPVRVGGRPVGVAGVDLTLEDLQMLVAPITIEGSGTAAIISPKGMVLAHPDSGLLGTDALKAGYPFPLVLAAGSGKPFRETVGSGATARLVTAVPISFGNKGENWTFVFDLPVSAIDAASRSMVGGLTALGAVLLALGGLVGAFGGSRLARPIQEMTRAMNALAAGRVDVDIPGSGAGDEIGQMASAMVTFRDNALERRRLEERMIDLKSHTEAIEALNSRLGLQNARFDAALTNMSQGLCMVDEDLALIVVNDRLLKLFDLAAGGRARERRSSRC